MLRPKTIHTRNLITKKISANQKFPTPIIFLMVCPLGQTIQPIRCRSHQFSTGLPRILPLERADKNKMYIKLIIYHIFLDSITHLF